MNRLFGGKNAKRQQTLVQHSLLDDDDDEDPFDDQTRRDGVAVYRPPPTTLLPEELQKEVVVAQSSPKAKSRVVVDRYKSSDNISPSKLSVPLSPKQTFEKFQRRFSSPDRKPQISTVASNGKVSMIQNLRDRMKFGIGGHLAATTTTNNENMLEPPSGPLTPPFSDLFSEPFSEPFQVLPDKEGDKVAPASEAFTVSCTSEELDRMFQGSLNRQQQQHNDENVAADMQQQRPKLKFSISSEPLPKPHTTATAAKLSSESKSIEDVSSISKVDNNESKVAVLNDIVLPGRKEDVTSGTDKEALIVKDENIPENPSMIVSVHDVEPTPATNTANIESNRDSTTNNDLKKGDGVKEASRVRNGRGPSSKSPQKRSSVREATDPSRSKTPESRPTSKKGSKTPTKEGKATITTNAGADEADCEDNASGVANVPLSRELKKSGSHDLVPKTPKRTKSSDNTMEFGIEQDKTHGKSDKKEETKKSSSSKDGGVINSKEEKKETRKSSKHKESKSSKNDDKSKLAHNKKHSCASPTKSKESSKEKTREKSSKIPTAPISPKPSSSPGKSKRRNSTNTNSIPIESGDLTRNSGMNEKAERRNSTGFVQAMPATLQMQKAKDKRRNSCTSIVSGQAETTMPNMGQNNAPTIILPDALQINDDVPPWVKAAMHMIEQYQKNKQYSPAMDPVATLISTTNTLPMVTRDQVPKQHTNKAPVRKDSASDDSSSYSTCSSDSDDRETTKEKNACKWVPIISIEEVTDKIQVNEIVSVPESKMGPLTVAENVKNDGSSKDERSSVNGQEMEQLSSSPTSQEGVNMPKTTLPSIPISKDKIPHQPNRSRTHSTSVELKASEALKDTSNGAVEQKGVGLEHLADLEPSRSLTPHRGMLRNASSGPKISLHSTSLLKRDITPSQRRPVADSKMQDVSNHSAIDSSLNAASSKEKFRELRRLARKAANEPVSSDDDCDNHKVNHNQLQRPIRAGGRKSSMRINNDTKPIPGQSDMLPSNSKGSDAMEGRAYGIDSTHETSTAVSLDVNSTKTKQERRGSAAFQKLLRIAQRTANEPSDDETLPSHGDKVNPIKVEEQVVEEGISKPTTTKIRPTPSRAKSKSFENIPSIQQRKQILFEK